MIVSTYIRVLNEEGKVCEWYSCLKMVVQAHIHVDFSQYFWLNEYHLNDSIYIWNCCNQAQSFKQKNNYEVSCDKNFCINFFTTPSSKNIIATLRTITIEISELTFLLILYSHDINEIFNFKRNFKLNFGVPILNQVTFCKKMYLKSQKYETTSYINSNWFIICSL